MQEKTQIQQTLEAVGIPTSLAKKGAEILQKQSENPFYQRTVEEQEIISHGHTWWVVQGMRTLSSNK